MTSPERPDVSDAEVKAALAAFGDDVSHHRYRQDRMHAALTAARSVLPEPDAVDLSELHALADYFDLHARAFIPDSPGEDAWTSAARSLRLALARTAPPTEPAEVVELRPKSSYQVLYFATLAANQELVAERDAARADLADRDKTIAGVRALAEMDGGAFLKKDTKIKRVQEDRRRDLGAIVTTSMVTVADLRAILDGTAGAAEGVES